MGRSMGGGGSRGGGSRSGGSMGRSGGSRSIGGGRSGTSRAFGSGHSGGSSVRGSGRSYSGQTSNGNPMMGGGFNRPRGNSYGGAGGFGGPHGGPGFHNPPPPPPPRHYHHYHRRHYYDYGGGNHVYVHHGSGGGGGCSTLLAIVILMIILAASLSGRSMYRRNNNMYYNYNAPSYQDSYSKVEREKFTGTVNLNGFYSDPDGLLYDDEISSLEKGLEHFYKTTGVCAYVYLVEALDEGVDGNDYAASLYDELFSDEGHILLLYDYTNAYMYDACGYGIGTTIDAEAVDIIYDYVEAAWADDSENLGNIFGEGCARAADRMMYKPKTFAQKYMPIIIVIIISITLIIIVNVIFKLYKAKVAQKNKEQEDLERTLNTPLETFGETPMDDLKKKYEDSTSDTTE